MQVSAVTCAQLAAPIIINNPPSMVVWALSHLRFCTVCCSKFTCQRTSCLNLQLRYQAHMPQPALRSRCSSQLSYSAAHLLVHYVRYLQLSLAFLLRWHLGAPNIWMLSPPDICTSHLEHKSKVSSILWSSRRVDNLPPGEQPKKTFEHSSWLLVAETQSTPFWGLLWVAPMLTCGAIRRVAAKRTFFTGWRCKMQANVSKHLASNPPKGSRWAKSVCKWINDYMNKNARAICVRREPKSFRLEVWDRSLRSVWGIFLFLLGGVKTFVRPTPCSFPTALLKNSNVSCSEIALASSVFLRESESKTATVKSGPYRSTLQSHLDHGVLLWEWVISCARLVKIVVLQSSL